jgi:hypothetical protein
VIRLHLKTKLRAFVASRGLYACWAIVSAAALEIARRTDPYVFAHAAFIAAFLSGVVALLALLFARHRLLWALLAAAPTAVSFWLLSAYKWN